MVGSQPERTSSSGLKAFFKRAGAKKYQRVKAPTTGSDNTWSLRTTILNPGKYFIAATNKNGTKKSKAVTLTPKDLSKVIPAQLR